MICKRLTAVSNPPRRLCMCTYRNNRVGTLVLSGSRSGCTCSGSISPQQSHHTVPNTVLRAKGNNWLWGKCEVQNQTPILKESEGETFIICENRQRALDCTCARSLSRPPSPVLHDHAQAPTHTFTCTPLASSFTFRLFLIPRSPFCTAVINKALTQSKLIILFASSPSDEY